MKKVADANHRGGLKLPRPGDKGRILCMVGRGSLAYGETVCKHEVEIWGLSALQEEFLYLSP